jgi:hypothetical protein
MYKKIVLFHTERTKPQTTRVQNDNMPVKRYLPFWLI